MISQLKGKIDTINQKFLVLDVNGVGYKIFCSSKTISKYGSIKNEILIITELIVKEDSLTLYGFLILMREIGLIYYNQFKELVRKQH